MAAFLWLDGHLSYRLWSSWRYDRQQYSLFASKKRTKKPVEWDNRRQQVALTEVYDQCDPAPSQQAGHAVVRLPRRHARGGKPELWAEHRAAYRRLASLTERCWPWRKGVPRKKKGSQRQVLGKMLHQPDQKSCAQCPETAYPQDQGEEWRHRKASRFRSQSDPDLRRRCGWVKELCQRILGSVGVQSKVAKHQGLQGNGTTRIRLVLDIFQRTRCKQCIDIRE